MSDRPNQERQCNERPFTPVDLHAALLTILADSDLYKARLEELMAAEKAARDEIGALHGMARITRKLNVEAEADKIVLANRKTKLDAREAEIEQTASQLERTKSDAALRRRESAADARDAALDRREAAVAKREADADAKFAKIKSAVTLVSDN